jgi:hypothetical protein
MDGFLPHGGNNPPTGAAVPLLAQFLVPREALA